MSAKWPFAYTSPSQVLTPPQGATAVESWWYEAPTGTDPEIWCYTDEFSYAAGDEIGFRVHTTASTYGIQIYRDGATREVVHEAKDLPGAAHETSGDCYETGCGWPVSFTLTVSAEWRSGGYVAVVTATVGERTVRHEHWFAVRPTHGTPDAVLLIAATATWTAYNSWGGSNHYEGLWGPDRNRGCPRLSTQRPWSRGMAWLPVGVPRLVNDFEVPMSWVPRYPAIEWAMANGYPKYTAAAGWGAFDGHFARWGERNGYTVDVATQHDLHFRPEILDGYRCVVIVGHDEYWSWEMRDHLDAYLDAGGRVAHLAANYVWQVRLEDNGMQQVCHKYAAEHEDDLRGEPDRRDRLTSAWDDPIVGRPAATTMGLTGIRGGLVKAFGNVPRGSGAFTVYRPEHWAFEGCDLYYGDIFGAAANVVAYEVDGLDYTMHEGLPYSTGKDGISPEDVVILAMSPASVNEEDRGHEGTVLFSGDTAAVFVAQILYGEVTPETIGNADRGVGMIAEYKRGPGTVLNAGTIEWIAGLRLGDPYVERITHNILRRFTRP